MKLCLTFLIFRDLKTILILSYGLQRCSGCLVFIWGEGEGVCVLILARMELISFTVACMELCFGFVLKTALITEGCFSYLHRVKAFSLPTPAHQQGSWRYIRIWEGAQLGHLTPADYRDIPDHIAIWFFAFQTISNAPNTLFINNLLFQMLRMATEFANCPHHFWSLRNKKNYPFRIIFC